jgi:hypothetical protein
MATLNLLYEHEYVINDKIKVVIPTVGQVLDNEDEYYSMVTAFTAMPIDLMVQLDDMKIDFEQITDYDLFIILFNGLRLQNVGLILKDIDFSKFILDIDEEKQELFLIDEENDIKIDRSVYLQISAVLRKIHNIKKNIRKPGNKDARDYMLKRAREKMKRAKNRKTESQTESLIVALVNAPEFKYDYQSVRDLTIYQFNKSLYQIVNRVDYNNRMVGIYTGNINPKDMSQDDLNWLTTKSK